MKTVHIHDKKKFIVQDHVQPTSEINRMSILLQKKYPERIPIVLEKAASERDLKELGIKRFLVPKNLPLAYLMALVRKRLQLNPSKALFFLIDGKSLVSLGNDIETIAEQFKSDDGLLRITYASQDTFG